MGDDEQVCDDLLVVACTMLDEKGCIDEQEWKDAVSQDQVLQELIRNLGIGQVRSEMSEEGNIVPESPGVNQMKRCKYSRCEYILETVEQIRASGVPRRQSQEKTRVSTCDVHEESK
ncbi:hypothetical protein NDU88_003338 [Pleurodeles waltl]|uniref:Uncharacterized protein n=1 Tax=Pleurodeles waltl TaxID=8319 RepID=A0AAV7QCH3_PLEWA|nr:hypothetical protein NDU88_003338 [Pleurodeles waltl]